MQLRLSWLGLIYLAALIGPNLIWTRNKPQNYEKYARRENTVLRALERTGETMVSCTVLLLMSELPPLVSARSLWLLASILFMVLYEVFWIRYFRGEHTMETFYASLLGIPVAGAALPVIAFALLAVYGRNPLLGFSVLIFAIGHIGIHLQHAKAVKNGLPEEDDDG